MIIGEYFSKLSIKEIPKGVALMLWP